MVWMEQECDRLMLYLGVPSQGAMVKSGYLTCVYWGEQRNLNDIIDAGIYLYYSAANIGNMPPSEGAWGFLIVGGASSRLVQLYVGTGGIYRRTCGPQGWSSWTSH